MWTMMRRFFLFSSRVLFCELLVLLVLLVCCAPTRPAGTAAAGVYAFVMSRVNWSV